MTAEWNPIAELCVPWTGWTQRVRLVRADTYVGGDRRDHVVLPGLADTHCAITRRRGGYALQNLADPPIEVNLDPVEGLTPLAHNDRIGLGNRSMEFCWEIPPRSAWPYLKTSQGMLHLLCSGSEVDRPSPRKYRLFLCARFHRFGLVGGPKMLAMLERMADGEPVPDLAYSSLGKDEDCWRWAANEAREAITEAASPPDLPDLSDAEAWQRYDEAEAEVVRLIRETFGNPFRPCLISEALRRWESGTTVRLAESAYHERLADSSLDPVRLGVLADALADAGCDEGSLLSHLREPGPHYRGCWAVDAVLGWS